MNSDLTGIMISPVNSPDQFSVYQSSSDSLVSPRQSIDMLNLRMDNLRQISLVEASEVREQRLKEIAADLSKWHVRLLEIKGPVEKRNKIGFAVGFLGSLAFAIRGLVPNIQVEEPRDKGEPLGLWMALGGVAISLVGGLAIAAFTKGRDEYIRLSKAIKGLTEERHNLERYKNHIVLLAACDLYAVQSEQEGADKNFTFLHFMQNAANFKNVHKIASERKQQQSEAYLAALNRERELIDVQLETQDFV